MSPKNKIYTDIKSKLMYLNSNPKAYNVDKFLECMSEENSVFLFYFIGINEEGHYKSELCSVYDKKLIEATVLQTSLGWTSYKGRRTVQRRCSIQDT